MKLYALGTGTLHPSAEQASAGFAVTVGDEVYGFDMGRSVLDRYMKAGLDPLSLRYLHISHLHPDHCCDLVPFLFALNYAPEPKREEPLYITAPEGFSNFFENLKRAWRWIEPQFPLFIREAEETSFEEGDAKLQSAFLDHGGQANLGIRIEAGGRSLVYTGDCGSGEGLLSLAKQANILLSECSFTDARAQSGHMSPSRLGQIAQAAECEKLVITHIYPGIDSEEIVTAIANHYNGAVEVAKDGLVLDV